MLGFGGGDHVLSEDWTAYKFQFKMDRISLQLAIGEIQCGTSTPKIRIHLISLAIQLSFHSIRGQDGSRDLGSVRSFDKPMFTSMHVRNLEMSDTSGDMNCTVHHFQSGSLGLLFIIVLVVCP